MLSQLPYTYIVCLIPPFFQISDDGDYDDDDDDDDDDDLFCRIVDDEMCLALFSAGTIVKDSSFVE